MRPSNHPPSSPREICHNMGLCYLYLKNYDKAEESFIKANVIQRHDSIYMQLGKLYTLQVPPGGDPGPTQRVGSENIPLFSKYCLSFHFRLVRIPFHVFFEL